MKKIQLNNKTVLIWYFAGWFRARFEGEPNSVFGSSEEECLQRLSKQLSVSPRVKYERA